MSVCRDKLICDWPQVIDEYGLSSMVSSRGNGEREIDFVSI